MFRVPTSAENPTFDDTFDVSFWRWLTSKKDERVEWTRRRIAAIPTGGTMRKLEAKRVHAEEMAAAKRAEREARRASQP
jgi:hypothetical protein